MWNEINPTTLYLGTTWELLPVDKYIQSGNTALSTGGNNSVSIGKANLPSIKLKIDSFSVSRGTMDITGRMPLKEPSNTSSSDYNGAFYNSSITGRVGNYNNSGSSNQIAFQASKSWTGMSTSNSPNTETLGSGTALSIQPEYITLKFWKRLS